MWGREVRLARVGWRDGEKKVCFDSPQNKGLIGQKL